MTMQTRSKPFVSTVRLDIGDVCRAGFPQTCEPRPGGCPMDTDVIVAKTKQMRPIGTRVGLGENDEVPAAHLGGGMCLFAIFYSPHSSARSAFPDPR